MRDTDADHGVVNRTDIVIIGGGLAGLCLARQLHGRMPDLKITVIEGQKHPLPDAGVKVGESTIEIAAHYFREILGLGAHFRDSQLPKFALRFYFGGGARPIEQRTELGVSDFPPFPTYQLDRGIFESFLSAEAVKTPNCEFIDMARVQSVSVCSEAVRDSEVGRDDHRIRYLRDGEVFVLDCRWVIDTSGRAGVLKKKFGLAKPSDHGVNAVWWRVKGRVDIRDITDDPSWRNRIGGENRWLSTNHLMGDGYWVWVIPLPKNVTSLGIVADGNRQPFDEMGTPERARQWLFKNEPEFAALAEPTWDKLIDFRRLRHFSHDCVKVFSKDRWAISGVAGAFLDPFYSPGSDYIAFANTLITELVERDRRGENIAAAAKAFDGLYLSFFENNLKAYTDLYPIFGNGRVMPIKIAWDYGLYWSVFAFLFINGAMTDERTLVRLRKELSLMVVLNTHMQALFRQWGLLQPENGGGNYIAQYDVEWLLRLNQALTRQTPKDQIYPTVQRNVKRLARVAAETTLLARREFPQLPSLPSRIQSEMEPAGDEPVLLRLYQALGFVKETSDFAEVDSTPPTLAAPNSWATIVESSLSGDAQSSLSASLATATS